MSAEGWSPDGDVARWEAVEAETRDRLEEEARQAPSEPEGPTSEWDADGPTWWQDPQAEQPPGAEAAAPGAMEATAPDPGSSRIAPEILLADADPAIVASLEQAMTARGWIVRRVDNGELALAEFLRLPPHCLVFDYSLPGMAGLDFLRKLREFGITDDTRLVVNSTQTQAVHVQRARALGAHRFLDRPVRSPDELVAAVAGQLVELGLLDAAEAQEPAPEPAEPPPTQDPEPDPSTPEPTVSGLFKEGSTTPPTDAGRHADPTTRPDSPEGERSYRSAFGTGGGPPGRVPKLG